MKQAILSLIGKLHFMCWLCKHIQAFYHHMTETSKKANKFNHQINLNGVLPRCRSMAHPIFPIGKGLPCSISPTVWPHLIANISSTSVTPALGVTSMATSVKPIPFHGLPGPTSEHKLITALCCHQGSWLVGNAAHYQVYPPILKQLISGAHKVLMFFP